MKAILSSLMSFFHKILIKRKFTKIYRRNLFGGTKSRSGGGSDLIQTEVIRKEITALLEKFQLKSLIDAPCGDFFWMENTHLPVNEYIGIDIVEEIIKHNIIKHAAPGRIFLKKDLTTDFLPQADIILCRDCLVHLSFAHSLKAIKNFKKSGAKYLLTTTFTERTGNDDLGKAVWRTLNLELPPFNFPKPLKMINENCTEGNGNYGDKSLGLWLLKDIPFIP